MPCHSRSGVDFVLGAVLFRLARCASSPRFLSLELVQIRHIEVHSSGVWPSHERAFEESKAGRIVLGGCLLRSTVAVCPHCHVGVEFRDWDAEFKQTD